MPEKHEKTLRQLGEEANRWAAFCFEPEARRRRLREVGKAEDSVYAVLAVNRFVPLDVMPAAAAVLRRRGRSTNLDAADLPILRAYWEVLGVTVARLHRTLVDGEAVPAAEEAAAVAASWPAVGVAESEDALHSLLMLQFERIRQKRISWGCADSSTAHVPTRSGMYLLVDWDRRA